MKRLLMAAAMAAVLGAGSAFANAEFNLDFSIAPLVKYNLDCDDDIAIDDIKASCPLGIDCQWGIFFGSPTDFLDLGMGLSIGTDFFTKYTAEMNIGDADIDGFGIRFNFTLGPAVRFNLGEMHSIYVSPGILANFTGVISSDASMAGVAIGFNLDAGYRIWLVRHSDSKFGLNVGMDLNFPFAGKFAVDEDSSDDYDDDTGINGNVDGGAEVKINIGLCFAFD